MADQCIVCLETLDVQLPPDPLPSSFVSAPAGPATGDPSEPGAPAASIEVDAVTPKDDAGNSDNSPVSTTASNTGTRKHDNKHDHVAEIQVCGHALHDSCLRLWTDKANSCPICRQQFHLVHVYDKIGGKLLSSYHVEDKKQVAEFDPQQWLDENPEPEEDVSLPCPVCNRSDNEEVLLLCDGCDVPYHTYCIGLERVPPSHWFCMECADVLGEDINAQDGMPQDFAPAPRTRRGSQNARRERGNYYFPRTQGSMRRARIRARSDEWQGAWGRIAGRVWDALSLDLDYQDDDGDDGTLEDLENYRRSQRLREQERLEHERWQQRLMIATRLGARDVFTTNMPSVFQSRYIPREPSPQQTREEERAWGAFEMARGNQESSASRKRKSRSISGEEVEASHHEPERKLKRPRTRRLHTHQNGEPSTSAANQPSSSTTAGSSASAEAAPSFLSSLLKEVEMSTPSEEDGFRDLPEFPVPGSIDTGSPIPTYVSPRATTPPMVMSRPSSPGLSSYLAPVYAPANFSLNRPTSPTAKTSRSSSPNNRPRSRTSPENSDTEQQRGRSRQQTGSAAAGGSSSSASIPIQTSLARRPHPDASHRSPETSPSRPALPLDVKQSINSIVRGALRPHWHSQKITAEQYEAINRDVSRKLYEEVKNPAMDLGEELKQSWEKLAAKEVTRAVEQLKA
ncbi:uncharacterized protein B0T23DRAFT_395213 [Neurospora hispaniola]|uniref:PHD and RING finger domain-containing protein n=1 Tax=Neurospora hispaniola TaxID=588809 RepID=A0AAJ0MSW0_9PEZI|nr:hypothetical protein B0T23DRAFT_395213 [Neurospora hispaniola]